MDGLVTALSSILRVERSRELNAHSRSQKNSTDVSQFATMIRYSSWDASTKMCMYTYPRQTSGSYLINGTCHGEKGLIAPTIYVVIQDNERLVSQHIRTYFEL